jgi:hypothetical protein
MIMTQWAAAAFEQQSENQRSLPPCRVLVGCRTGACISLLDTFQPESANLISQLLNFPPVFFSSIYRSRRHRISLPEADLNNRTVAFFGELLDRTGATFFMRIVGLEPLQERLFHGTLFNEIIITIRYITGIIRDHLLADKDVAIP